MSLSTAAAGTIVVTPLVVAAETVGTGSENVRIGAVVKAIYIELWVRGAAGEGAFQVVFGKGTAGSGGPTFAEVGNLHDYNEKNNVFYFSQALGNDNDADAIPVMKGWFKIPKGKQRMANGERFYLGVAGLALGMDFCGMATYKEYF